MRPVLRGVCKLESLYDGTLDLEAISLANDSLDVMDYNDAKSREK